MTDKEIASVLEARVREDGKRPPAAQIQELIRTGLIDEDGRVYTEQLRIVRELLREKSFGGIDASHSGQTPGGAVRLREKHEGRQRAEAPFTKIRDIIAGAKDENGLWDTLAAAGYCQKPRASGMKKTG